MSFARHSTATANHALPRTALLKRGSALTVCPLINYTFGDMRVLLLILAFVFGGLAHAKEALIEGGRSKDGRFEVRVVQDCQRDPSDYVYAIYNTRTNKRLVRFEDVGGIDRYGGANHGSKALWDATNRFVTFTDSGTRHSTEVYVFEVSDTWAQRIDLPDFVQNALGRVGATEIDLHCGAVPKHWDGGKLHLDVGFSVSEPTRGRLFYDCEVVLELQPNGTSARLMAVTKPKSDVSE